MPNGETAARLKQQDPVPVAPPGRHRRRGRHPPNAVAAHPEYARAYDAGWRSTRSGLEGDDPTESVWLRPSWALYERWCHLQILRLVKARATPSGGSGDSGVTDVWRGATPDGIALEVRFQLRFPAHNTARSPERWSISKERVPDIVVAAKRGRPRRFLVLDAKYSAARTNVLEAMTSAHVYRDALRWEGAAPDQALLLVPAGEGGPWLEAPEFIRSHGVGVVHLAPDRDPAILAWVLEALIERVRRAVDPDSLPYPER